jgi:hypothetical protein
MDSVRDSDALAFLRRVGAAALPHPGGTLLAHLIRTAQTLERWDADPALVTAGLCHAAFGTVGFPFALISLEQRGELALCIGTEAEAIVEAYSRDDRTRSLGGSDSDPLCDRYTGTLWIPSPAMRRHLAELSAANELDVLEHAALEPPVREALKVMLANLRVLLSVAAARAVDAALAR